MYLQLIVKLPGYSDFLSPELCHSWFPSSFEASHEPIPSTPKLPQALWCSVFQTKVHVHKSSDSDDNWNLQGEILKPGGEHEAPNRTTCMANYNLNQSH